MSKGSLQRPFDRAKYAANYERIFGGKKKKNTVVIGGMEVEYCPTLAECGICLDINPKSESCEFCKRNPDAIEIQTRFFCPERGEPLDG